MYTVLRVRTHLDILARQLEVSEDLCESIGNGRSVAVLNLDLDVFERLDRLLQQHLLW